MIKRTWKYRKPEPFEKNYDDKRTFSIFASRTKAGDKPPFIGDITVMFFKRVRQTGKGAMRIDGHQIGHILEHQPLIGGQSWN